MLRARDNGAVSAASERPQPVIAASLRRPLDARSAPAATDLQNRLVKLVALGRSDKEIAAEMGMSYRTVRTHLERLFARLGVHCRTALAVSWGKSKSSSKQSPPKKRSKSVRV